MFNICVEIGSSYGGMKGGCNLRWFILGKYNIPNIPYFNIQMAKTLKTYC
jgi:hypothetical protein